MRATVLPRHAGFSLIELLVAMTIGAIITLAVTRVMVSFGEARRTGTALNDTNQTAGFASYVLDRYIRNAGSGFAQHSDDSFGCLIYATQAAEVRLPAAAYTAVPFNNIPNATRPRRLMPVLIEPGLANVDTDVRGDIITVMAGTSGWGETGQPIVAESVTSSGLQLPHTQSWSGGDLLLLADNAGVPGTCMLEEVTAGFVGSATRSLTFNTSGYYNAAAPGVSITDFGRGIDAVAIQLGNVTNNPPEFQMFAVGDNATLLSYNLLQPPVSALVPIADGVVEMRALYGITTTTSRVRDSWTAPTGAFAPAILNAGSAAARTSLKQIVSVRIGLILRSSLRERDIISQPRVLVLFDGLTGLTRTRTLTDEEMHFRYRTIEMTIPLRNMVYEL